MLNTRSLLASGYSTNKSQFSEADTGKSWSWIPPRDIISTDSDEIIAVKENVLLNGDEICEALERQGAENVVKIELSKRMDTITHFVIATGRSPVHIYKMGETITKALKLRHLHSAPGITGIEGSKGDDWLVVDCFDIAVHLFTAGARKEINLESHWSKENEIPDILDDDAGFDNYINRNPISEGYHIKNVSDTSSIADDMKKIPKNVHSL